MFWRYVPLSNDHHNKLRIVWVTRSFLDYRIPVFAELDRLCGGELRVVFSGDYVPQRVIDKARAILGDRAIALKGEWSVGNETAGGMANRVLSLRVHPGLPGLINSLDPQVLIGDGFFKWTSGALSRRMTHGTPLVICYERTAHTERRAQWYRLAYRRAVIRFVDAICCNGRLSASYAATLGMPEARITTGQMAADTTGIAEAAAGVIPQKKGALKRRLGCHGKVLLYVGRMIALKGLDYLISAWSKLDVADKATLLCVGGGDQLEKLRGIASALGLKNVIFTGEVDYDGIAEYYAMADAFVIPTLEDNWSLVVPEAMAAGLAVLCSKYNGCWPELVHNGVNGWVFDPLDHDNTVAALNNFIQNANKLSAMGEKSREIVAGHTPAQAGEAIYESCLRAISHARQSRPGFSDLDGALIFP